MRHSKEFITEILELWYIGCSAREISKDPLIIHMFMENSLTSETLTKNMIIGIINRNGGSFKKGLKISEDYKPESFQKLNDEIKQYNLKKKMLREKNKYRERKCLKCQEIYILPKNIYFCEFCTKLNKKHIDTSGYSVHLNTI
mgnify:FL=1|jgi:hypothetical protein|tara:strand:+ start:1285 stop:1713 length:429 start_codon:yes stop_codon:yes gene_type:complete